MVVEWLAVAEWIGILGGAVIGLKILWSLLKKLGKKIGNMFGLREIKSDIGCLAKQIESLVSEFRPNGGTSMRDLMDRVETELSLSNERQRARMLDAPEMIFETDVDGNCIWVNRTYSRGVQRSLPELLGHGWVLGIAVKDRDRVVDEWYKSVEEDREFEMIFDFQTPDGVPFTVEARSYKMCDLRTGKAVGYLGHCIKI